MGEQIGNAPADALKNVKPGKTGYLPMKPHEFFDCMMRPGLDERPRYSFSKTNPQDTDVSPK